MQVSPVPCIQPLLLLQIFVLIVSSSIKGTASDEAYKGRKWTTGGDGHYSLVVSADDHELHPQESVGYALVLQEKKMGKIKPNEEMAKLLLDKYDKVTERLIMKENRKRQRLVAVVDSSGNRKRRRNPVVASTTGLPQTMSYNLYNHFRPLEQDVPQDHILPFLDFGRKLSTGSTPSGANSIELSSTPRISQGTTDEPSEARAEEQLLDEMDVTVTRKAAERNSPPRTPPVKPKKSTIISFFGNPVGSSNETEHTPGHIWSTLDNHNKTDSNYSHHDLQPNESNHKPQIILSPDYGLRLKKTMAANERIQAPTETITQSSPTTTEATTSTTTTKPLDLEAPEAINTTEIRSDLNAVPELPEDEAHPIPKQASEPETVTTRAAQVHSIITLKDPHTLADIMPLELVKPETKFEEAKEIKTKDKVEEIPLPIELKADRPKLHPIPDPSPTARILSTAVVTSVSVKESPRFPRGRNNHTSSEVHHRINPMKPDVSHTPIASVSHKNNSDFIQENRTALLQNLSRRKFTTFRPKTTSTFRTVTFRNQFRRNSTSHAPATVHVVSTPPSYIEVPRIAPIFRNRAQPGNFARKINSHLNAALTLANQTTNTTSAPKPVQITTVSTTSEEPKANTETDADGSAPPRTEEADVIEIKTAPIESDASTVVALEKSYHDLTQEAASEEHLANQPAIVQVSTSTEADTKPEISTTHEPPSQPSTVHIRTQRPSTRTTPSSTTPVPSIPSETQDNPTPSEETVPQLEIEFKPLDEVVHPSPESVSTPSTERTTRSPAVASKNRTTEPSTTSPRPSNFTIPHIPDLLWVYGQRNNHTVKTQPSTVGVAFHDTTWGVATYVLMALGTIPLLLGTLILIRQILLRSKKKVLDESEYSSEYNRSPLPTKLPRLPAHINWEEAKSIPPAVVVPLPTSSAGSKWEFPRDKLRLQTVLGQGNFGQVWKAEADDISGHEGLTRLVAVKMVKEGASQREKEDLLRELAIMQELAAHPNVVTLLGCCTDKEPYLLIMEYVMYGKLLAFLREHRSRAHYFNFSDLSSALNSRDLTVFSYCVARGMEYLASKGIIHRDLAARNILVDHNKLCKIADFGMSRNVRDTGEIYEQRPNRGALPIRWMAPESLHYNLFTQKSDVWSFGVLLWEIVTLGSTPYSTMGAREVMRQVLDGYRLEKPKHCKSEFFKVLTKCWHNDPNSRPTFSELKSEIGLLLGTTESEGRFVDLEAMTEEIMDQSH